VIHWQWQRDAGLDFVTVGDFAWYDSILQTACHLGAVPERFGFDARTLTLPQYFALARGTDDQPAMELTKWFDTNYHYLVPEWSASTRFDGGVDWLFEEVEEARALGHQVRVALPGPLTLLYAGKIKSGLSSKLNLLSRLVPAYQRLLARLEALDVSWVQLDEPILGLELDRSWLDGFQPTYRALAWRSPRILLATYFESVADHAAMLTALPVAGIHLDLVRGPQQLATFLHSYPASKVLSLGVVDGRNVWRTDLDAALTALE
jgi:5-methyltetrahydropteroyltriglutamate--homocysteine methyltransferase